LSLFYNSGCTHITSLAVTICLISVFHKIIHKA
jgi:hypothetical protein